MSEQNPQVRRPQTLDPQERPSSAGTGSAGGPPSGVRGAAATYGLNSRPSGIRPLPELPPGPDVSFKNFGLLNAGEQSKSTLFTSVTLNITAAIIICLLSVAAKKVHDQHKYMTNLVEPIPIKKQEEVKPKPKPPEPKVPPPPVIEQPKIEPPKIQQVKLDMPKPVTPVVRMTTPVPVLAAAPLKVTAPPAPKLLANLTQAAAVKNNDAHPSAVALGSMNNPMQLNRNAAPSKINLGNAGVAGMPSSNSGHGPVSLKNTLGSGAPNGSIGGRAHAAVSIAGLSNGVPGGQGTARTTTAVNIAPIAVQQQQPRQVATASGVTKNPTVTSKPTAHCTDDANRAHIEGQVAVSVDFLANGGVQVLGVTRGLGHGLDESAKAVAQGMRFTPATTDGRPVDFKTTVLVTFACSPQ